MRVGDALPQLKLQLLNRRIPEVSEAEALALYEANRAWVDRATMTDHDQAVFDRFVAQCGRGIFHDCPARLSPFGASCAACCAPPQA